VVWVLIILLALEGLAGIICGPLLMIKPDGSVIQMPLSIMRGSPFTDFFIPGLVMFLFLGIFPSIIAYGLWKKPAWIWPDPFNPFKRYHWSWAGSLAAGIILMIWLTVELIWVEYSILHAIYYVWGGTILLLTLLPAARSYLEKISDDPIQR